MKKIIILSLIGIALILQSCGTSATLSQTYPKMYSTPPLAIAVMPPINQTNNVEAKEFFYLTLPQTLCERGYYVVPSFLSLELFKSESAYDAEIFESSSLSIFNETLGADAVLFTYITDWKKSGFTSSITVSIEYILRSTTTSETLFQRKGTITYDTSVNVSGGGIFGALAGLAASALNTALSDYVPVARACNQAVLIDLPAGKYSPSYEVDKDVTAGPSTLKKTVK